MTYYKKYFQKLIVLVVILTTTSCLPEFEYHFPSPYNPDYKEAPSGSMKFLLDSLDSNYKLDVSLQDYYKLADPFCKSSVRRAMNIICDYNLDNPSLGSFLKDYADKVNNYLEIKKLNVLREGRLHYTAFENQFITQNQVAYYEDHPQELFTLLPEYIQAGMTSEEYFSLLDPTCLLTSEERNGAPCSPEGDFLDDINLLRQLISKLQVENNPTLSINPKLPDYSAKAKGVAGFTFPTAFFSVDGKFAKKTNRQVFQLGVFPIDVGVNTDVAGDDKVKLYIVKETLSGSFDVSDDGYSFEVFAPQATTRFDSRYKIKKNPDDDLGKDKGQLQFVIYGAFLSKLNSTALNGGLFDIVSSNITIETGSYIATNTLKAKDLVATYQGYSYGLISCNGKIYSASCVKGDFNTVQRADIRLNLEVKSQNVSISGEFDFDDDSNGHGISDVYFKSANPVEIVVSQLINNYPTEINAAKDLASFAANLCNAANQNSCNKVGITRFLFAGPQQTEIDEIGGIYRIFSGNKMFVGGYGAKRCEELNCPEAEED